MVNSGKKLLAKKMQMTMHDIVSVAIAKKFPNYPDMAWERAKVPLNNKGEELRAKLKNPRPIRSMTPKANASHKDSPTSSVASMSKNLCPYIVR